MTYAEAIEVVIEHRRNGVAPITFDDGTEAYRLTGSVQQVIAIYCDHGFIRDAAPPRSVTYTYLNGYVGFFLHFGFNVPFVVFDYPQIVRQDQARTDDMFDTP